MSATVAGMDSHGAVLPLRVSPHDAIPFWEDPRAVWCFALMPHLVATAISCRAIAEGHRPGNLIDFLGAARQMLAGADIYAGGTGGYVYPPLIAFLYQPLAMMSERSAAFISLGINAALSVLTLALASRMLVQRIVGRSDPLLIARVALFGAICTADKIKGEFFHIETNVFMLLAFTVAMKYAIKRPWLCGLALGFAFNIKYMPLVLVPYLLLRRQWRAVGWFAIWAVGFALLPAISMGLKADVRTWAEAGGGILRLFGINTGVAHAARVRDIADPVSISLTSGLARITHWPEPHTLALAGCIGAISCLFAVLLYRGKNLPVLAWPCSWEQRRRPYLGLATIEWLGILLFTLIFSPFTNSRHLYMLMDVNIAAGALLLGAGGVVRRLPLLVAAVVMALGVTFPPGGIALFSGADAFWRNVGGPAWCMLALFAVLLWTNSQMQREAMDHRGAL